MTRVFGFRLLILFCLLADSASTSYAKGSEHKRFLYERGRLPRRSGGI